ncbi:protein SRC2-like [Momordica charantia]|uniref:Protein SRC2-like n=1 Tax=Momordica charantia TaxID=3673 RepID=A0A6J1CB10_MOMCH|nr:protein SRC2-like [Momordica charantia]
MESTWSLEINVVSAKDLPEINLVSKMAAYVVVSLAGGGNSDQKFKTNADSSGGINPNWNFPMKFSVNELASTLVFTIRCFRTLGDRDVTYPVRKPSGKTHGLLNFQYRVLGATASFRDEKQKPPAAYATRGIGPPPEGYPPPPHPAAGYPPPPPPPYNTGYAPPPPQPYGYPHYGYPAPPPPGYLPAAGVVAKKETKSGMGKILAVGAGILGGLACGAMLGECAADLGQPPSRGSSSGNGGVHRSNFSSMAYSQNTLGGIG